jgi:hypothetical protein
MIEKELWGELSMDDFSKKINELTNILGKPRHKKRLGLEVNDYSYTHLDTRIRITNGNPVIVQKVGNWVATHLEREEYELELPKDVDQILIAYNILINQLNSQDAHLIIIQNDNYLFTGDDFEIKLAHQYGRGDVYLFEIEALTQDVDLSLVADKYSLKPDLTVKDAEFWQKFNQRVNIDRKELNDDQLRELIEDSLKSN